MKSTAPASHYEFSTHWRVRGSLQETSDIIVNALDLPRWWPDVYLSAKEVDCGPLGPVIELCTRGRLPYTLCWRAHPVENRAPFGLTFDAEGDLVGRGVWTLSQDGEYVKLQFDWRVDAKKPLLRWLSPLLRSVFVQNHDWAMARGEESLKLELERRRVAASAQIAGALG
jgi:hypothetical protein